jgi:hypothetical protein
MEFLIVIVEKQVNLSSMVGKRGRRGENTHNLSSFFPRLPT